MVSTRGTLQVVATPIGNLADLSPRAREVLATVAVIAAEDTRHTRVLLKSLGLTTPLVSLHAHNESQRVPELLARLARGADVALVSDAGTPLLSDPGFELVSRAAAGGLRGAYRPGALGDHRGARGRGAADPALLLRGLPAGAPRRAARRARASGARDAHAGVLRGAAPHPGDARRPGGQFGAARRAVVARELTKAHETLYRGTLGAAAAPARAAEENFARGELTLVVAGAAAGADAVDAAQLRRTMEILLRRSCRPDERAAAGGAADRHHARGCLCARHPGRARAASVAPHPYRGNALSADVIDSAAAAICAQSRPGSLLRRRGGGKSGLRRIGCQVTPGGREPTESATESRPPKSLTGPARVKRCGKSAPRRW